MKQLIKLFLIYSILYGAMLGSLFGSDFAGRIKIGLISGAILGTVITVFLFALQYIYVKREKLAYNFLSVPVNYSVKVEIKGSSAEVFQLCMDSVASVYKAKIQESSEKSGYIQFKVGMTFRTWGDIMRFYIKPIHDDECEVIIESSPIIKTTMIDYGKNVSNVRRVVEYLESKAHLRMI